MWPAPCPWVELIADEIRERAGVRGPPYNMRRVAMALGYSVCFAPDLGGPCGLLVRRAIVIVESACSATRAMTIGHELGHALNNEWRVIPDEPLWNLEIRMDEVAAAIIAPRRDLYLALMRRYRIAKIRRLFQGVPHAMVRLAAAAERLAGSRY